VTNRERAAKIISGWPFRPPIDDALTTQITQALDDVEAAARADEREACAQIAGSHHDIHEQGGCDCTAASEAAEDIRARGNK